MTQYQADAAWRAERQLPAAHLEGDATGLYRLLKERLVATGPAGSRHSQDDDLSGYRTGSSVVTELVEEHVEVLMAGTTGVTFFIGMVSGPSMVSRCRPGCAKRVPGHDGRGG